jgi:protease secretion system outer membrane protein
MMNKKHSLYINCLIVGLTCCGFSANATTLLEAFTLALDYDPQFQAAKNEKDVTKGQAYQGYLGYLPKFSYNQQQLSTDVDTRVSRSINQPIFDADKAASLAQAPIRETFGEATFLTKEQDLAQRIVKGVNAIISSYEAVRANESRIKALSTQYQAAKRKYALGQGTISDELDIQVKFEQAKADMLTLKANYKIAQIQLSSIVGQKIIDTDFRLPAVHKEVVVDDLELAFSKSQEKNPNLIVARTNERLAKFDILKTSASILPTVSFTNMQSQYLGNTINYNGLTVSVPIDTSAFAGTYSSNAKAGQLTNQRVDAEIKAKVEIEKLYSLIEAGQESIKIKKQAIDAAEKSVKANQMSYEAGVRTLTDVLNSIQTQFQAMNDYSQAVTGVAENILNFYLLEGYDSQEAIIKTQTFLFNL